MPDYNSGVLLLNNTPPTDELTLIISGVGRCGTSMIAEVLHALQFNLGEFEATVNEDVHMHYALGHFYHEARYQIINYRNTHMPKWGFKFPGIQNHLFPPEITAHFRKPRIVIMQRDNAAIAARLLNSDRAQFKTTAQALKHASKQQDKLLEFACEVQCPVAVISYEKFIKSPKGYVEFLIGFCGLTVTLDQVKNALEKVMPDNPDYVSMFQGSEAENV